MGTAVGGLLTAATMTAGALVAAPSAKADLLDDILDPILQPLLAGLTDALSGIDPAAATDLTGLLDLGGLSLATNDPAAALSGALAADPAAAVPSTADSTTVIPLHVAETTEPYVDVSVNGGSQVPVLVDTGSSGLVIPWQDVGLSNLAGLGFPTGIGISGYSGGVDYLYLTFDTTVNYGGELTTSSTPVYVELFSWPTSATSPTDFQQFLADDQVEGILGLGSNDAGPGTSPLEAAGYPGVLVDEPAGELVVGSNSAATAADVTVSGAPLANLDVSINGGPPVAVTGDIDSGGVYGTMPQSVTDNLPAGTTITVYDNSGQELYSYATTSMNDPTLVSSSSDMDTGYVPFSQYPIYVDYANDTTTFDLPGPSS
jgi:hypothetical protein